MNESLDFNWIRQIRVTLSGLVDKSVPNIGSLGIAGHGRKVLEADGSANKLRISTRIHKFMGLGDPAQIDIWNLSADTKSGFQRQKTKIKVEAGWKYGPKGGQWQECFSGNLQNAESRRSGTDIVTTIYALSGLETLAEAEHARTFNPGESVFDAVKELANRLAEESNGDVKVDPKNIVGIDGVINTGGWSTAGSVMDALDYLGEEAGFSWSIDDGQFKATGDESAMGKTEEVEGNNLIDVNPHFATTLQMENGISFRCVFNAGIRPHQLVDIQSSLSDTSRYNGKYKVHFVSHSLDTGTDVSFITHGKAFILSKR